MMNSEFHTQSFIIKIWLEETAKEAGTAIWRGHITHVPSGKRHYIQSLGEITAFIVPYLEGMGVRFEEHKRIQQWLKQLRDCLSRNPHHC